MKPKSTPALKGLLLLLYGVAFGLGTNFIGDWFYPIRGIGLIDFILIFHFIWLMITRSARFPVWRLPRDSVQLSYLIMVLTAWLLLATLVNTARYELEPRDIFAILRLLYFLILLIFIARQIAVHGFVHLLVGYLFGTAITFYQDFSQLTDENMAVKGIQVLSNSNVIGAQLGLAVFFSSIGVLVGHARFFLLCAIVFAIASITTFSKGAWLIVGFGLLANLAALYLNSTKSGSSSFSRHAYVFVFVMVAGGISFAFWDQIWAILEFKLLSTQDVGSFNFRRSALLGGLYAALENPLFGLGFSNYYQVQWFYPELMLSGLTREDNAHNLFGQIAAVGGIPALALLVGILISSLVLLTNGLRERIFGPWLVKYLYILLAAATFFMFASVQLQLIAQPSFWFYCALLIGWRLMPSHDLTSQASQWRRNGSILYAP